MTRFLSYLNTPGGDWNWREACACIAPILATFAGALVWWGMA